jgi:hypothetical protein
MSQGLLRVAIAAMVISGLAAADRTVSLSGSSPKPWPEGWKAISPREEIRPRFAFDPGNGHGGAAALIIVADQREGQTGYWTKSFPVVEGRYYRFQAFRKVSNVATARRSARVMLKWVDAQGKSVPADLPWVTYDRRPRTPSAWPEFPIDKGTDTNGWTEVTGVYRVPQKAARAVVELFEKKAFALSLSLRRKSYRLPWKSFVPPLVTTLTNIPPPWPYSASSALVWTVNSATSSTLGM